MNWPSAEITSVGGASFPSWTAGAALTPAASAGRETDQAQVRGGDTIVVAGVPVRLRGLHCPELGTPEGERAHREMVRLVSSSPAFSRLNGEQSYDRQVGWCSIGGEDLRAR